MAKSREDRLREQGYREYKPGYFSKPNTRKTEFNGSKEAEDHYSTQRSSSGDLMDNSISSMVNGGGK